METNVTSHKIPCAASWRNRVPESSDSASQHSTKDTLTGPLWPLNQALRARRSDWAIRRTLGRHARFSRARSRSRMARSRMAAYSMRYGAMVGSSYDSSTVICTVIGVGCAVPGAALRASESLDTRLYSDICPRLVSVGSAVDAAAGETESQSSGANRLGTRFGQASTPKGAKMLLLTSVYPAKPALETSALGGVMHMALTWIPD